MTRTTKWGLAAAAAAALALPALGQLALTPAGTLTVDGDSTLHKWSTKTSDVEMTVTLADGAPQDLAEAIKAGKVKTMEAKIPVAALKSGENGMDKNMRESMNVAKFPDVLYKLDKYEVGKAENGVVPAKTTGELTIDGQTKTVPMDVEFRLGPDGPRVQGSYTLKMSEYGIKPPTLMFGTIKVRDPVTIHFDLLMKAAK